MDRLNYKTLLLQNKNFKKKTYTMLKDLKTSQKFLELLNSTRSCIENLS